MTHHIHAGLFLTLTLPAVAWGTPSPSVMLDPAAPLQTTHDLHDHEQDFSQGVEHEVDLSGLNLGDGVAVEGLIDHTYDRPMTIMPMSGSASNITITGRVFYEDHRTEGQFHRREDRNGDEGIAPDDRVTDNDWLLGAYYMMVDIYERDDTTLGLLSPNCALRDHMGSAFVQRDGSFSLTFSTTDDCEWDAWSTPRFSLRVRSRFCSDDLCFQIGPGSNSYYELWYDDDAPFAVSSGSTHDVGDLIFSSASEGARNDWSRAANQYASIVDSIVTLHNEEGIPFRMGTYGGLQIRFPSIWASGRATDYDLIDLDNSGWPGGGKAMHEYGHIVHRRAWGGDYAGHHDPIQSWGAGTVESRFIAMKEGWANFVQRYVNGTCFKSRYDDAHGFHSLDTSYGGERYPENHHRMLCDWVDNRDDRREGVAGVGDIFTATLWSLWHNLDETDETIASYGGNDPEDPGLGMCDMVGYYLEVRKSEAEVGTTAHDQYVWWIASLLEHSDISCPDVPTPSELRAYDYRVEATPEAVDDSGLDRFGSGTRVVTVRVEVDNTHPFIAAEGGQLSVYDVTDGTQLMVVPLDTLEAGELETHLVDVAVEMIHGEPVAKTLRARVADPQWDDLDRTNNITELTLDASTLRPNLELSVSALVPSGELPESLPLSIEVTNDGLTEAALAPRTGRFSRVTTLTVSDSLGETLMTRFLTGDLAVGETREVSIEVDLSATLRASSVAHLNVRIDARDVVPELNERDNVATVVLKGIDFLDFPELDRMDDTRSDLVTSSMWVEDLQHDMFEDALASVYPWLYQSPVDRAFAEQLQELPTHMTERVWGERQPSQVSVGIELGTMPRARQADAAQLAQRWRWLP